jgi:hypothetical protein
MPCEVRPARDPITSVILRHPPGHGHDRADKHRVEPFVLAGG